MSGHHRKSPAAATSGARGRRSSVSTPYIEPPLQRLLSRLERVRETAGGQYLACCPAHDDGTPSLSIRETGDGTILLHCFALCPAIDVLAAVGMELADLFPNYARLGSGKKGRGKRRINPLNLLRALDRESLVVVIIASDVKQHREIDKASFERLALAASRIGAVRELYR